MRVVVHRGEIALMMSPAGEVGKGAERAAGKIRDRAKEGATVDTGLMRNSIFTEIVGQGATSIVWRIQANTDYAIIQEEGTGPIFARRAPLLVFQVGGRWVSTYSTRGVPAVHFLRNAIEAVSAEDFD